MKQSVYFLCAVLLMYGSVYATEKIDAIVAVVGDSVILESELEAYTFLKINQSGLKPDSLEMQMLRRRYLDELIEGKVLLVYAEKDTNITVSEDEVEREVDMRIKYIMQQNRLTAEELDKILVKEQGISLKKFRREMGQQLRQELLKQKIQYQYAGSYKVNRQDIESFYHEYKDSIPSVGESIRLSEISIRLKTTDETREQAYQKIMKAKEGLDKGASFIDMAKEYSDDPNSESGGDLGYIGKGTLNELSFEEKIFSLKPGQISQPFESRLGWHIVEILDRKDNKVHVRQIFTSTKPSEKEIQTVTTLLDSIRSSCRSEKDFTAAVRRYSTNDLSRAHNGLLPWSTVNELNVSVKNAFDTMTVGALSEPVRLDTRVVLYRIHALEENRKLTLKDDWNEIAQLAQRIYQQKKLIELVRGWKDDVFIDIRL